jgi:hypothetical protein
MEVISDKPRLARLLEHFWRWRTRASGGGVAYPLPEVVLLFVGGMIAFVPTMTIPAIGAKCIGKDLARLRKRHGARRFGSLVLSPAILVIVGIQGAVSRLG